MQDNPVIDITFNQVAVAPAVTDLSYFVGTQDNNDGTFTDYRFTPAQLMAHLAQQSKRVITVTSSEISNAGQTLTHAFFSTAITEIRTNNTVYIAGADFTQNTFETSVTWINGSEFFNTQILIAEQ